MRWPGLALLGALAVAGMACSAVGRDADEKASAATKPDRFTVGPWHAGPGRTQTPIWPGPAPDGTLHPQPPETVQTYDDPPAPGGTSQAVLNVAVPTMTVVPPTGSGNGTAVVVFPGGGFQKVFVGLEGTEICTWLSAKGVTCIVSKYRAPGGNDYWDDQRHRRVFPAIPRALQDAQRTIRLVRAHAAALGIDPHRIGVMGFSAGGYLVAQTSNILTPAYTPVDAIDRISSRPDFAVALYPGHLCRDDGTTFDPMVKVTKRAPPTFLVQAWDDPVDPICNSTMYARALDKAGVSTEVHLFAHGGHAFALRKPDQPIGLWPQLVERWLRQIGML